VQHMYAVIQRIDRGRGLHTLAANSLAANSLAAHSLAANRLAANSLAANSLAWSPYIMIAHEWVQQHPAWPFIALSGHGPACLFCACR
jgi:hypothetical protein